LLCGLTLRYRKTIHYKYSAVAGVMHKTWLHGSGVENVKVRIGGHSKTELLMLLSKKKVALNAYATMIFMSSEFVISESCYDVFLQSASVESLGLIKGGTFDEIVESAYAKGMSLCPIEVAPYLRLEHQEATKCSGLLTVASKLFSSEYMPNGFYLRAYDGHIWLRGYKATHDVVYEPGMEFVFTLSNA
jgi:hypothetical protein